jgi:hypothetical protein
VLGAQIVRHAPDAMLRRCCMWDPLPVPEEARHRVGIALQTGIGTTDGSDSLTVDGIAYGPFYEVRHKLTNVCTSTEEGDGLVHG